MILKLERTIYKVPLREATQKKASTVKTEPIRQVFRRGDNININIEDVDYPGKPDSSGGNHDTWRFRHRDDQNQTFEFTINDCILELILFESEREVLGEALVKAPFSIGAKRRSEA
jgi:hypothetical protein